jgi:phosphoribosylformimino-5-aminoimidazole carboxamide ribotide isomerase
LLSAGVKSIVAGLETIRGPEVLSGLLKEVSPSRLVFSLDLKNGEPLTALTEWWGRDAYTIAVHSLAVGVKRLLVLDLANVGGGGGTGTEDLCLRIRNAYPDVELLAGGGIHGPQDVERLQQSGLDGVLVASVLHEGRLSAEFIACIAHRPTSQPKPS